MEYAFHVEKRFEGFVGGGDDESFAGLEARLKQGRKVLSRLPGVSLRGSTLVCFLILLMIHGAVLGVFVACSGQSVAYFVELGRVLYGL